MLQIINYHLFIFLKMYLTRFQIVYQRNIFQTKKQLFTKFSTQTIYLSFLFSFFNSLYFFVKQISSHFYLHISKYIFVCVLFLFQLVSLFYLYNFQIKIADIMSCLITLIGKWCFHIGELRELSEVSKQYQNQEYSNQKVLDEDYKGLGFKGNKNAYFYPYNHTINDQGWGCAWRIIQTMLSCYKHRKQNEKEKQKNDQKQINLKFRYLFETFGKKQILMQIAQQVYSNQYQQNKQTSNSLFKKIDQKQENNIQKGGKSKNKILAQLQSHSFAPIQVPNNWAQPLIGHLICHHYGIPTSLILLNGYPQDANAPQSVFQRTVTFQEFVKLVQDTIQISTIFLDDSTAALSIMAFKKIQYYQTKQSSGQSNVNINQSKNQIIQYHFIIGDPHVKNNRKRPNAAIFLIKLDKQGKRIPYTNSKEDQNLKRIQKQKLIRMKYDNITSFDLSQKKYMVLMAKKGGIKRSMIKNQRSYISSNAEKESIIMKKEKKIQKYQEKQYTLKDKYKKMQISQPVKNVNKIPQVNKFKNNNNKNPIFLSCCCQKKYQIGNN